MANILKRLYITARAIGEVVSAPILGAIKSHPWQAVMSFIFSGVSTLAKILSPIIFKSLIENKSATHMSGFKDVVTDNDVVDETWDTRKYQINTLISLWAVLWTLGTMSRSLLPLVKVGLVARATEILNSQIVDGINHVPLQTFYENDIGQYLTSIANVPALIYQILITTFEMLETTLEMIPTLYILFDSAGLNNIIFMVTAANFLIKSVSAKIQNETKHRWYHAYNRFNSTVLNLIRNHEVVLQAHSQNYEHKVSTAEFQNVVKEGKHFNKTTFGAFVVADFFNGLGLFLLNLYLFSMPDYQSQLGNIVKANLMYQQLTGLLARMDGIVNSFSNYSVDILRINTILALGKVRDNKDEAVAAVDKMPLIKLASDLATATNERGKELAIRAGSPKDFKEAVGVNLVGVSLFATSGKRLLTNINIHCPPGEITVVCGEIGSGKSSVGRIIAGLYKQSTGDVRFCRENNLPVANCKIVVVPADHQLFENRSVFDNILYNISPSEAKLDLLQRLLDICKLRAIVPSIDAAKHTSVVNLSTGQKKCVALARGLASDSHILILDEPTENLDEETRGEIISNILKFCAGKTVIIISHDAKILSQSENVIRLRDGEVISASQNAMLKR